VHLLAFWRQASILDPDLLTPLQALSWSLKPRLGALASRGARLGDLGLTADRVGGGVPGCRLGRVHHLNSYRRGCKCSDDLGRGLRESLEKAERKVERKVELSVAYLDSRRFPDKRPQGGFFLPAS
jgi:hypothetical protein